MNQTINELERDIEETRARLDLTIDRIQDKMSMSGIVDDVVGSVRRSGYSRAVDQAMLALRDNPVPVLLMVVGLGWLIHRIGSERRARPVRVRTRLYPVGPDAAQAARPGTSDDVVTAEVEVLEGEPDLRPARGYAAPREAPAGGSRPLGEATSPAAAFSPGRPSPVRP